MVIIVAKNHHLINLRSFCAKIMCVTFGTNGPGLVCNHSIILGRTLQCTEARTVAYHAMDMCQFVYTAGKMLVSVRSPDRALQDSRPHIHVLKKERYVGADCRISRLTPALLAADLLTTSE